MCQQVFLEVTFPCAFVLTLIAAERLFSGVNKHMLFQITSCCERGGTHGASVAFLSLLLYFGLGCKRHFATFGETAVVNKIFLIALRGSTPKRDTQQQCVRTISTAKPYHAMSHHDIKCNTIQVQPVQCNPVPFHATPYRAIPCNAMPPHAIQRHSLLIQYHTMQRHVTSCHAMEIRAI